MYIYISQCIKRHQGDEIKAFKYGENAVNYADNFMRKACGGTGTFQIQKQKGFEYYATCDAQENYAYVFRVMVEE